MKIVVNDVAATPDAGGVFSILSDFYNDIYENDEENEWIFILAGKYFKEKKNISIIVRNDLKKSSLKKFIFEIFFGGKFINNLKPDVYISLQNISTLHVKAKRKIVYVHQPLPFTDIKIFSLLKKNERKLAFYQKIVGRIIKYSIKRVAPYVIVQTEWMKKEILVRQMVEESKIFVNHPVVKNIFTRNIYLSNWENTFFFPASSFIYKNHNVIIEAVNILISRFHISNFLVKFTINEDSIVTNSVVPSQIEFLGKIDRKDVFDLYYKSILIFPSYLETYGLPLLEAKNCGTIILAANTSFSHEILDAYENAYFFEPFDSYQLAVLMYDSLTNNIKLKPIKVRREREIPLRVLVQSIIRESDVIA
ncbi:glycosyltransferase [Liquorilactobacillus hordei]|uniref:Glycosyl transferase family 1 domain-containing protein n=1 Tax=Liquorilactobacillus hordei TaxID=468911 RepID=A0A3S6QND9_9LACO|nr:glycosyltransferase [Liquorilactobacillus hordei]AUJ29491.1 hypothetical protein BSQ49_04355 [Liquorilactobacillus hordei]